MTASIIPFPVRSSDAQDRLDVVRDVVFSILDTTSLADAKALAKEALAVIDGDALG